MLLNFRISHAYEHNIDKQIVPDMICELNYMCVHYSHDYIMYVQFIRTYVSYIIVYIMYNRVGRKFSIDILNF